MLTLSKLIDEDKCDETVCTMHWPKGICCIECGSKSIAKRGKHETYPARQRYVCGEYGDGFGALLCSCLRPHQGISQENSPIYLRFFEFIHNARKRGKDLLGSLLSTLLAWLPEMLIESLG